MAFKKAFPGNQFDWPAIRDRIDLAAVATSLLGPAPKRSGRRLLWLCPFHEDHDPSFQVDPAERRWRCWPCDLGGDAPALVMRLKGMAFPEAVHWLAEQAGIAVLSTGPARPRFVATSRPVATMGPRPAVASRVKAPDAVSEQSSGLSLSEALTLVQDASERIWMPEGGNAVAYLEGRGLTAETIRRHRLGWVPSVMLPTRDGVRYWRASGITLPWLDGDRLTLLKIRQPEGAKLRYAEAFRDRPTFFPAQSVVRPGEPLVIAEGEFDALLLGQELRELAAVVTVGSASTGPDAAILGKFLIASRWYLALDGDEAGDRAALKWPAPARRVRPPTPHKDWTEARQAGIDLRRWWVDRIGMIESRERPTGDELVERHGPGNRFDRSADESDRLERAAIMEFDGGLSREAAERVARLH